MPSIFRRKFNDGWLHLGGGLILILLVSCLLGWDIAKGNSISRGRWIGSCMALWVALLYVIGGLTVLLSSKERYRKLTKCLWWAGAIWLLLGGVPVLVLGILYIVSGLGKLIYM